MRKKWRGARNFFTKKVFLGVRKRKEKEREFLFQTRTMRIG